MGHITTGGLVSEVRGSVGSLTYSRNAYGPYVKAKLNQTVRNTSKQIDRRNNLRLAVASWRSLTDTNRKLWTLFAKDHPVTNSLGKKIILTGYNMYIRCFLYRRLINRGAPLVPGRMGVPPLLTRIDFEDLGGLDILINYSISGIAGWSFLCYFAEDREPSVNSLNPSLLKYYIPFESISYIQFFIDDAWTDIFNKQFPFNEDRHYWVGVRFVHINYGFPTKLYWFKHNSNNLGAIFP